MVLFGTGYAMAGSWTTLDAPGATDTEPFGIDGDNIVGTYLDGSSYHGFVYTVPEPSTLLLLGLGVVMLGSRPLVRDCLTKPSNVV